MTPFARSQDRLYLVGNRDLQLGAGPTKKADPSLKPKQQVISEAQLAEGQTHVAFDHREMYEPFGADNDQVFTVEDSQSRSSNWPRAVGSSNQSLLMNANKPFVAAFNQNGRRSNQSPEASYEGTRDDIGRHYISIPYPKLA